MYDMKLIVGLGNPGKQYEKTRHNAGFFALNALHDALAEYGISAWELSKKFNAVISGCSIKGENVILAKPMTFMNDSGIAVQLLAHFYKLTAGDILVVHDDKDLPLGTRKLQENRGDAGHNGVKSVISRIGAKEFARLRIGIASDNPKKMRDAAAFVLGRFGILEKKKVEETIRHAVEEIRTWLQS